MSKLTIDDRRDNQEVTGVIAARACRDKQCRSPALFVRGASYRVICAARSPFRAIDCIMTLARMKTVAPATTSASKIVMFISPPNAAQPIPALPRGKRKITGVTGVIRVITAAVSTAAAGV